MYGYSYNSVFRKSSGGVSYSAEAQALFDVVTDVPEAAKQPINDLIVGLIDSGAWANSNFELFISVPSTNASHVMIDIKSLTTNLTYEGDAVYTPPYNTNREVVPSPNGVEFAFNGYLGTGFVPSASMTLNDSCVVFGISETEIGASTYNFGSYNSASQDMLFSRSLSGTMVADMNNTSINNGRIQQAATDGSPGVFIMNRLSNVYYELIQNTTSIGTAVNTNTGTLPTPEVLLNKFNLSGGPSGSERNQSPIWCWGSLGSGFNSTNRDILTNAFTTFKNSMLRDDSLWTKQLIFESNSHGVYWISALYRSLQYHSLLEGWRYDNISSSGQTTTQMIADYNNVGQPGTLYDGSFIENWYIPYEVTNDLYINNDLAAAKTRYQTLCTTAQTTGYKVLACPIMCRKKTGSAATIEAFNQQQNDFNVWLFANYSSWADAIVPIDPKTFIYRDDYGSAALYDAAVLALVSDTNEFYDGTHRTEAGYIEDGRRFMETINAV